MSGATMIVRVPSAPSSPFLRSLAGALASAMHHERELTMKVGVMTAAGLTRSEMVANLKRQHDDVDELDIRMAHLRLRRIGELWRG